MESFCVFYASKYHLGMILMEYLKGKNTERYTIRTNLKEAHEIDKLNHKYYNKNIVFEKISEIKSNTIYILEGKEEEIKEQSNKIEKMAKKNNCKNIELLKCYDFNQYANSMNQILEKNDKILNTSGKIIID